MLNGSNSRFLNLSLRVVNQDGSLGQEIPMTVIGGDQSLLKTRINIKTGKVNNVPRPAGFEDQALLMAPSERYDVLVNFRNVPPGTQVRMINTAPDAPFGGFPDLPADPATTGQVMQFHVGIDDPTTIDVSSKISKLRFNANIGGIKKIAGNSTNTRQLALIEEESSQICVDITPNGIKQIPDIEPGPDFATDCAGALGEPFAPKQAILGNVINGAPKPQLWSDPVQQAPALNSTETWVLNNYSADAHPIHIHLVRFKVQNRSLLNNGGPSSNVPYPSGIEPIEKGWKDTVIAYPGESTSVIAKFDIEGLYVWHCHILEHEDHEMMVPFYVGGNCNI